MSIRWLPLVVILYLLAACQPQPTDRELPTLISLEPTATATSDATATPEPPTPTATREIAQTPTVLPVGRFATDPKTLAYVRVIHAAPETTSIDVRVETVSITSNLARWNATGKINIAAGEYTINIAPYDGDAAQPLASRRVTIAAGESKILLFSGTPDALNLTEYQESLAPLNERETRVNFINAVPRFPDVTALQNDAAITDPIAFDNQSGERVVPPLQSTIAFAESGQTVASLNLTLQPRTTNTFVLVGDARERSTLAVLAFTSDVPGTALVRVINMASDSPIIDVLLNDYTLTQRLETTRASNYITVNSGTQAVNTYDSNNLTVPLLPPLTLSIAPDDTQNLVLLGTAERYEWVVIPEDRTPIRPGAGRMVFVNTLADSRGVLVGLDNSPLDNFPPLNFSQVSQPRDFDAGVYNFNAVDLNTNTEIEKASNFALEASRYYVYMISGRTDDQPIVFSSPLAVDESLASADIDATPDPFANVTSRIRFINMIDTRAPINVTIANQVVAENINYADQSGLIGITGSALIYTITSTATGEILYSENRPLTPGDYSLYLNGTPPEITVLNIADLDFQPLAGFAQIRLINLTGNPSHVFRLGQAPATDPQTLPPLDLTPSSDPLARPSAPLGIARLSGDIRGLSQSLVSTLESGIYDFIVLDSNDAVAVRLRSVALAPDEQYEIVAIERGDSGQVEAVVLKLPKP